MKKRYCNTHEALVPTDLGLFCNRRLYEEVVVNQLTNPYKLAICETSTVFIVPIDDPNEVLSAQKMLDAYI